MESAEPQSFARVLSSMCTEPHPDAREAAIRFLATNPGDPSTYPTIARLEEETVDRLGDIVGLSTPYGYLAGGGTEANIQAVRAARNLSRTDEPAIVVPESAHFSFRKAAEVLGVELRTAPTTAERRAEVDAMAELIDENTVLVAATAGTTEFGRVDPIPELAALAADAGIRFHVDAAWGGFVLPFTDHEWNFEHAPIDTMTVDPHKMGQAAIPAGGFLARDLATVESLAVETPYLETERQPTLAGTRSGAGVASAHAALRTLWPDGYRETYRRCQENARWFAGEIEDRGFEVVPPELPLVAASIPEATFDLLRNEGWRIARTATGELRVVCMPHLTRETLDRFLSDFDRLRLES